MLTFEGEAACEKRSDVYNLERPMRQCVISGHLEA